jgi:hypothetical protein
MKLIIDPEFDDKNNQTGRFMLEVIFALETEQEKPDKYIVADLARYLFDYYTGLISFLTGNPVQAIKPPEVTFNYPGTNRYRKILFPEKLKTISPPVPLSNLLIFSVPPEPKLNEALGWLQMAIHEKQILSSFMLLWASLEIISNQFDPSSWAPKKCINCGHVYQKNPSTTDRIKYLILDVLKFSEDEYNSIWETRNKIAHGGLDLTYENRRKIYLVRNNLYLGVIKALKILLNISASDFPSEIPPFPIFDPLLDVDYTTPIK